MKAGVLFLNSMFLLMFISVLVAEWGNAAGLLAGLALVNLVINSVVIMIKVKGEFADQAWWLRSKSSYKKGGREIQDPELDLEYGLLSLSWLF